MASEKTENKVEKPLFHKKLFTFQPITHLENSIKKELYEDYISKNWLNLLSHDKRHWYNINQELTDIYHEHSIQAHFHFREITPPKRCVKAVTELSQKLYLYLKLNRKQVSKSDTKVVARFLIKHLSRLKYHKGFGLRYNGNKNKWVKDLQQAPSVMRPYFLELLNMLEDEGLIIHLRGFGGEDSEFNITNMIIPTKGFLDYCNGKNPPEVMENCLRRSYDKLCIIRERVYSNNSSTFDKIERKHKRGEKAMVDSVIESMRLFNQHLEKYEIEVNGVCIPETFYHRTYIQDLHHGGRLICGEYQGKSKKDRLTTLIDGLPTISLDYKSLHLSLAATLAKWGMKDHDPYNTSVDLYVNWWEVLQHEQEYGVTLNPLRNICKVTVLTLLNARDKKSAKKAIAKALLNDYKKRDQSTRKFVGLSVKGKLDDLIEDLIERNIKVKGYFCSDFGIKAQNLESNIMQICVDTFCAKGKVILPVHDSCTVTCRDMEDGLDIMELAYESVMGSSVNCKIEIE